MNSAVISRQAADRDLQAMLDTLVPAFADDPELVEIAHGLLGSHADVFLKGCELLEESHLCD